MRFRTYEVKDTTGKVVESGMKGWWINTINLANLTPNPTTSISGIVSARGGWCNIGKWSNPDDPHTLQCSASRWADLIAQNLNEIGSVTGFTVIDAIAKTLETLEDERLAPPTPLPPDYENPPLPEEPTNP